MTGAAQVDPALLHHDHLGQPAATWSTPTPSSVTTPENSCPNTTGSVSPDIGCGVGFEFHATQEPGNAPALSQ